MARAFREIVFNGHCILFCYDETMNGLEIVARVKKLGLPAGEYVVFGSCPMAMAGIREAHDIDILVSPTVLHQYKKAGWKQANKGPNDKPLTHEVFEMHDQWNFSSYKPTLDHLLETAQYYDDVPFASLEEVRKWKIASGRPKDLIDISLIESHLAA